MKDFLNVLTKTNSAREDLLEIFRNNLLFKCAENFKVGRILVGDCGTRTAISLLTSVAKGRGFALPQQISDSVFTKNYQPIDQLLQQQQKQQHQPKMKPTNGNNSKSKDENITITKKDSEVKEANNDQQNNLNRNSNNNNNNQTHQLKKNNKKQDSNDEILENDDNNIVWLYPMREFLSKEICLFNHFHKLNAPFKLSIDTNTSSKFSINRLTESKNRKQFIFLFLKTNHKKKKKKGFIEGLQSEFGQTVFVLLRSAAKLTIPQEKITKLYNCCLCGWYAQLEICTNL